MASIFTTAAANTIVQGFQARFARLHTGTHELCQWCGRGFHAMLYAEWRRVGMGYGWDPRDPDRHNQYGGLLANLTSMHRAKCKPILAYDTWWADPTAPGGSRHGTRQEANEDAMFRWFGLRPAGRGHGVSKISAGHTAFRAMAYGVHGWVYRRCQVWMLALRYRELRAGLPATKKLRQHSGATAHA